MSTGVAGLLKQVDGRSTSAVHCLDKFAGLRISEEVVVLQYECFLLDSDGRLILRKRVEALTDDAALESAKVVADRFAHHRVVGFIVSRIAADDFGSID